MIDWNLFWPFVLAAVVLVVVPGPDMILIVTLGTRHGKTAGVAAAAGVAIGLTVHIAITVLGLSALLHKFPAMYQALKWLGVIYLVYLAISSFRADHAPATGEISTSKILPKPVLASFRSATITNLLNPKVILFNLAFLPQFTNPDLGNVPQQLTILGLVLVVIDFAIDGPIGYLSGMFGDRIADTSSNYRRRINNTAGAIFLCLAGWLATT